MTEIISLNQLYELFKYFVDNHKQLRDFGYGGLDNTGTGREMSFPYLWITRENPSSVTYNKSNNTFVQVESLTFIIVDQHNNQENSNDDLSYSGLASDNGVEITSDMRQIGADLLTYIKDYMTDNGIDLVEQSVIFEEILHETTDDVSGWKINLDIELNYSNCTIPGINTIPGISSCPEGRFRNSDNTFSISVPSGTTITSDDIEITVNSSTYSTIPSNLDYNVIVKNTNGDDVGTLIDSEWIVPSEIEPLDVASLMKTGATVSYQTNDDGDRRQGRNIDFFTLDYNNPFGNNSRFTDKSGTQIYSDDVVIDWSTQNQITETVLCYYRVPNTNSNLTNQLNAQPYTRDGVSDWYVCNYKEMVNIQNMGVTRNYLNYPPFNFNYTGTSDRVWCSTRDSATVGIFFNTTGIVVGNHSSSYKAFVCRIYTLSELGL